jgi:hypothetical protein
VDDRSVQLVAACQLGELPPLLGLDFEHRLQRTAWGLEERDTRELDRVLRPGGGGAGENPADAQALVVFGGRPHRLDGLAQPLVKNDKIVSGSTSGGQHSRRGDLRRKPRAVGYTASLVAGQELFQVVPADQPAAPCFHRSELAGAQQVVLKLP